MNNKKKLRKTITVKDVLDMLPKEQLKEDTGLFVMCEENNDKFIPVRIIDIVKTEDQNELCLVPAIPLIPDYVVGYLVMGKNYDNLKETVKKLQKELRAAKKTIACHQTR